jgi:hypothetical protein
MAWDSIAHKSLALACSREEQAPAVHGMFQAQRWQRSGGGDRQGSAVFKDRRLQPD